VLTDNLKKEITKRLEKKWSPEQISNPLKLENKPPASTETIYKFIYTKKENGAELWKNLRRSHCSRKPRFPFQERRGRIKDARPIFERNKAVNDRTSIGHWERDTMICLDPKSAVLAFVDRKSRFNRFIKLNRRLAPKQ
jgi:transposase, IS30 family